MRSSSTLLFSMLCNTPIKSLLNHVTWLATNAFLCLRLVYMDASISHLPVLSAYLLYTFLLSTSIWSKARQSRSLLLPSLLSFVQLFPSLSVTHTHRLTHSFTLPLCSPPSLSLATLFLFLLVRLSQVGAMSVRPQFPFPKTDHFIHFIELLPRARQIQPTELRAGALA